MVSRIRQFFAPPVFEGDEDKTRAARLLNSVLWAFMAAIGLYGIAVFALPNPSGAFPPVIFALVVSIVAMVLMRSGYLRHASWLIAGMMWILLTVVGFLFGGLESPAVFGYIVVVIIASLLSGWQNATVLTGLSILSSLAMLVAASTGVLPAPRGPNPPLAQWAALSLYTVLAAALLDIAARGLNDALARSQLYASQLEEQRNQLETTVAERTRALSRRASYLETTVTVAREATAVLDDPQRLIEKTVNLVSERFGFYHTGLFLADARNEWAELRAASSEGGQRMLARHHRLRIGQEGIVGYVVGYGRHRIALDVGKDAVYFDNPDMPETRSEVALPLRVQDHVIGALDVQSKEPGAFTAEDVSFLQALADQVAVAINNARLFQEVQERAEAERRAYGELSREAWQQLLRTRDDLSFLVKDEGLLPAGDVWRPEMERALHTGQVAQGEGNSVAIPIKARGQVIGVIDGRKPEGSDGWMPEEIDLLQELTERLNVTLEGARLYRESQRRAAQEALVGEVTTRMRETLDVNAVLETAVQEISSALGLLALDVRLGARPGDPGRAAQVNEERTDERTE
ncbi:MAG: GAF domain-containing protein [Anaerolineae bacterium]|nr:GAF domain-containing protein [Anaerolineae bacterium]